MSRNVQAGFDRKGKDDSWMKGWREGSDIHHSLSGARWGSISSRCLYYSAYQKKQPTYLGCENRFCDFDSFVEWSMSEVGYSCKEKMGDKEWFWQLDKDIISRGNKVYSPERCIFVPQHINKFVSVRKRVNGLPLGVSVKKKTGKYISQCMNAIGKVKFLGYFDDPMHAHRAWQEAKIESGHLLADNYKEFHPKLYTALTGWIKLIEAENLSNSETKI